MPNLIFYISENHSDKFKNLNNFTHRCSDLCCDILGAELKNVHIIFINVNSGCWQPVYAELFYRLTTLRTQEVMENFIRELDFATHQDTYSLLRIPSRTHIRPQLIPRY